MAERRGHPVAAVFLVLVVLPAAATLGVVAGLWFFPLDFSSWIVGTGPEDFFHQRTGRGVMGSVFSVAAVAVLVGGLWVARRVGTGYWGRRPPLPPPPFDEPPPRPPVGDDP